MAPQANSPSQEYNSRDFDKLYVSEFQRIHGIAKRIVSKSLTRTDRHLRSLINLVLDNQEPTEYPFMFRQCFGHIEQSGDELDTICAAMHLLQTSTFVIDDIFDGGTLRNNKLTVFGHAGVNYAIVVGEMLQTAATQTIDIEIGRGKFKNKSVVLGMAHEMLTKVYLGQYLDIYNSSNSTITLSDYKRVISLTTGGFLADIARCGALLAGTSKSKTCCLAEYAYKYGMALQITDDIVDVIAPPHITGKNFASDLRCQRMRLPFVLALKLADRKSATALKLFLRKAHPSDAEINRIVKVIKNCGAIEACLHVAKGYLDESLKDLSLLEESQSTARLHWLSTRLLQAQALNR